MAFFPQRLPPGQGCKWEPGLLKQILTIVGKIDPDAEINYNIRDAIHIKPSKCKAFWLRLKTKQADALEVICFCKKGQFNLDRIEGLAPGDAPGYHQTQNRRRPVDLYQDQRPRSHSGRQVPYGSTKRAAEPLWDGS